jgi:RimJ/RimL family protein N-acetyltransferase
MKLETARLTLRQWENDDVAPFWEIHRHPELRKFLTGPNSLEETEKFVSRTRDHWTRYGYGLFAVEEKTTGQLVGFTGLIAIEWVAPVTGVEIAWRLRRDAWGKGYATEAARACLPVAFETLSVDPLVAIAVPENVRSHRVMERLGFVRTPEKDFDHPRVAPGHRLSRHWAWELSRAQWLKAAGSSSE